MNVQDRRSPGLPSGLVLASPGRRAAAWLLDTTLFALPAALAAWVVGGRQLLLTGLRLVGLKSVRDSQLGPFAPQRVWADQTDPHALLALAAVAGVILGAVGLWVAYRVALTAWKGATLGKAVFGLRVVRYDDPSRPPDLARSFARFAVPQAAGLVPVPGTGFLTYLWLVFDRDRQGAHDKAARTLVVCHRGQTADVTYRAAGAKDERPFAIDTDAQNDEPTSTSSSAEFFPRVPGTRRR